MYAIRISTGNRDRERERETDRQTDGRTDGRTDIKAYRSTNRQI